jgi:hypothetical protein
VERGLEIGDSGLGIQGEQELPGPSPNSSAMESQIGFRVLSAMNPRTAPE